MDAQESLNETGVLDTNDIFQAAESLLLPTAGLFTYVEANRLDVQIHKEKLLAAVKAIIEAKWGHLSAITGLDYPPHQEDGKSIEGMIEALYHFCNKAVIVTLRIRIPYNDPTIPSICSIVPVATLYERELMEMFGVEISGTPDPSRLLLPDDWPDGVYPLRKSFTGLPANKPMEQT
ncbi:MAG TPA: NADH-quinone oxidoreductase subunit C [Anaerolineaceae bacterium]